jgi:hypothetical protein
MKSIYLRFYHFCINSELIVHLLGAFTCLSVTQLTAVFWHVSRHRLQEH